MEPSPQWPSFRLVRQFYPIVYIRQPFTRLDFGILRRSVTTSNEQALEKPDMTEHEQLLEEARKFCDRDTGEVLERIPEELMGKLRAAKLARGVPGKRSERTESHATWFVFLSGDIRESVLAEWREAHRQVKRYRKTRKKAKALPVPAGAPAEDKEQDARGLGAFRQRRKSAK